MTTNDTPVRDTRATFIAQCNVASFAMRYMGRKLRKKPEFVASMTSAFDVIDANLIDDEALRKIVDAHLLVARSNITPDCRVSNVTNTITRLLETHFNVAPADDNDDA